MGKSIMNEDLTLYERILRYLKFHKDRWVPANEIYHLAKNAKYDYEEVGEVLNIIEGCCTFIGSVWYSGNDRIGEWAGKPKGKYLRYYEMSQQEIEAHKARLAWFDDLGDELKS